MKTRMLLVFALLLALLAPFSAAQVATVIPLPADLQGELDGVPYRIVVPANWNGTLLVYAYGYAEAYMPPPLTPQPADVNVLLAKGFALAGIHALGAVPAPGGATDSGWNMKERIQNTAALTAAFRQMVGKPLRTIAWGKSMGGLVALGLIEKFPGLYDGAVPLCAPAAGTPSAFDQKLGAIVAYAAAFGWKTEWGTPGDLRPDLNFMTEVAPHVMAQMTPAKLWRWEFFRLVNRLPADNSFYAPPLPFVFQTLWLAFVPQIDLNRRAGGRVADNIGRVYALEANDRLYLQNTFQVTSEQIDELLAAMNAQTVYAADRNARNYAEHYFNPTGRISRPVLMLHTTGDAAAIPNNESAYRAAVELAGNGDLLMQEFSTGNGTINTHCTFKPAQYLAGIDAMMSWLDSGTRPDASTFFPATLGFDPSYVPAPWPW